MKQCTTKNEIRNKPVRPITNFFPIDDFKNPLLIREMCLIFTWQMYNCEAFIPIKFDAFIN